LLERDTKLSQEVGRVWTEIMLTETLSDQLKEPSFDRLELLAEELIVNDNGSQSAVELKQKVLNFFDKYFAADSPERRAMSSRVYSQKNKAAYEEGAWNSIRLCRYLSLEAIPLDMACGAILSKESMCRKMMTVLKSNILSLWLFIVPIIRYKLFLLCL
jgi:hypothetical protein